MLWLYILLSVVALLLLLLIITIAFANYMINLCFKRMPQYDYLEDLKKMGVNTSLVDEGRRWLYSQNLESHYIKSRDGLKLHASVLRSTEPSSKKLAVLVHGYHGSFDSFSNVAQFYHYNGFTVLMPDQRTHGKSEGEYITFGAFERYDVVDWCNYGNELLGGDCKILLSGVSMGTTTVLLASAEPDMPALTYITADCGFTDPKGIFRDVLKSQYHLPSFPLLDIARLLLIIRAKFDYCSFTTIDAVKALRTPISFIHGQADDFVSIDNSYRNYEACTSPKVLITVPGAKHGVAYLADKERIDLELERIVSTYFD